MAAVLAEGPMFTTKIVRDLAWSINDGSLVYPVEGTDEASLIWEAMRADMTCVLQRLDNDPKPLEEFMQGIAGLGRASNYHVALLQYFLSQTSGGAHFQLPCYSKKHGLDLTLCAPAGNNNILHVEPNLSFSIDASSLLAPASGRGAHVPSSAHVSFDLQANLAYVQSLCKEKLRIARAPRVREALSRRLFQTGEPTTRHVQGTSRIVGGLYRCLAPCLQMPRRWWTEDVFELIKRRPRSKWAICDWRHHLSESRVILIRRDELYFTRDYRSGDPMYVPLCPETALANLPEPPLKREDRNEKVMRLQFALIAVGFMRPSDIRFHAGIFGRHTASGVCALQAVHALEKTSIYDANTCSCLGMCLEHLISNGGVVPMRLPHTVFPADVYRRLAEGAKNTHEKPAQERLQHTPGSGSPRLGGGWREQQPHTLKKEVQVVQGSLALLIPHEPIIDGGELVKRVLAMQGTIASNPLVCQTQSSGRLESARHEMLDFAACNDDRSILKLSCDLSDTERAVLHSEADALNLGHITIGKDRDRALHMWKRTHYHMRPNPNLVGNPAAVIEFREDTGTTLREVSRGFVLPRPAWRNAAQDLVSWNGSSKACKPRKKMPAYRINGSLTEIQATPQASWILREPRKREKRGKKPSREKFQDLSATRNEEISLILPKVVGGSDVMDALNSWMQKVFGNSDDDNKRLHCRRARTAIGEAFKNVSEKSRLFADTMRVVIDRKDIGKGHAITGALLHVVSGIGGTQQLQRTGAKIEITSDAIGSTVEGGAWAAVLRLLCDALIDGKPQRMSECRLLCKALNAVNALKGVGGELHISTEAVAKAELEAAARAEKLVARTASEAIAVLQMSRERVNFLVKGGSVDSTRNSLTVLQIAMQLHCEVIDRSRLTSQTSMVSPSSYSPNDYCEAIFFLAAARDFELCERLVELEDSDSDLRKTFVETVVELHGNKAAAKYLRNYAPSDECFSTSSLEALHFYSIPDDVSVDYVTTPEGLKRCYTSLVETCERCDMPVAAVDAEWEPNVGKAPVALLQIALPHAVFLVDILLLREDEALPVIWRLLCNSYLLVGFCLLGDVQRLLCTCPTFTAVGAYLDIRDLCSSSRGSKAPNIGLSTLTKSILGCCVDKSEQTSHWGERPLRESQCIYAAIDAYILLPLFVQVFSSLAGLHGCNASHLCGTDVGAVLRDEKVVSEMKRRHRSLKTHSSRDCDREAKLKSLGREGVELALSRAGLAEVCLIFRLDARSAVGRAVHVKTIGLLTKDDEVVLCVLRAACRLNISKTAFALGIRRSSLRLLREDELIERVGYERGCIGPIGVRGDDRGVVLLDTDLSDEASLLCGAGEEGLVYAISPKALLDAVPLGKLATISMAFQH